MESFKLIFGGIILLAVIIFLLIMIAKLIGLFLNKCFKNIISTKKIFIALFIIAIIIFPSIYFLSIIKDIIKSSVNEAIVNNNYENQIFIEFEEKLLIKDFIYNEYSINEKLKGKVILLTGIISSTARPIDNIPYSDASYIIFGNDNSLNPIIQCYFNKIVVDNLEEGETISIIGKYRKYVSNPKNRNVIIIGDSKIIK